MKRLISALTLLLCSFLSFCADYDSMWKEVGKAREADMPRQAVEALDRIISSAAKERCHGEMLAATVCRLQVLASISADSIAPELRKIVSAAEKAEHQPGDEPLAALYYTVLSKWAHMSDGLVNDSMCRSKALAHPDILAMTQADGYSRMADLGNVGAENHNSLLSVVGHELRQFAFLKDYYRQQGNRRAACLEAYNEAKHGVMHNEDMDMALRRKLLRDAIAEYSDIPEAALLASAYYNYILDDDVSDAARYIYLNNVIEHYAALCDDHNCAEYLNGVRNALLSLTCPSLSVTADRDRLFFSVRNVSDVNIEFMPLAADGRLQLEAGSQLDRAKLLQLVCGESITESRHYSTPSWQMHSDTVKCPMLPPGVYLVKAEADGLESYSILYNTDVALLSLPVSKHRQRIIAVSAATGQPLPEATIVLTSEDYKGNVKAAKTLQTDRNGEAIYEDSINADRVYAYTATDRAFRKTHYYAYFNEFKSIEQRNILSLFTDRAVYRPGQTVKGCVVAHNASDINTIHSVSGQKVVVTLLNMHLEEVFCDTIVTNIYGNAEFSVSLPDKGINGAYTLACYAGNAVGASSMIRVEEYKRPTFEVKAANDYHDLIEVDIPKVNPLSHVPDTIGVTFAATDYSGVPVRNAHVIYSIVRRQAWHGWKRMSAAQCKTLVSNASALTDGDGNVIIPMPLTLPDSSAGIYTFEIKVGVTNLYGETQEAMTSVRAKRRGSIAHAAISDETDSRPDNFEVSASRFPNDGSGILFTMRSNSRNAETRMPVHAYYTLFGEGGVIESGQCVFDTLYTRRFRYDEKYGEGLTIAYSWIQNGVMHEYVRTLMRPLPDMSLRAAWSSFRDRTQPGADETWTLHIAGCPRYSFIATVYDKSIDALMPSSWNFTPIHNRYTLPTYWQARTPHAASCHITGKIDYLKIFIPDYARLKPLCYPMPAAAGEIRMATMHAARPMMKNSATANYADAAVAGNRVGMAAEESRESDNIQSETYEDLAAAVRSDFGETAFFGAVVSDEESGGASLTFRMPQTVTTWRVRGFAYDSSMRHCFVDTVCVAAKSIVVKPNVPRFLRQHDSSVMTAEIQNTTASDHTAEVVMQLLDMTTGSMIWQQSVHINIAAGSSVPVSCEMPAIEQGNTLIFRIVARTADGMSDGEQHFIPVVPETEVVTTTRAFTQHGAGVYTTDIADLIIDGSTDKRLRVKYTEDAAQMIAEAIPQTVSPSSSDALSLASALYVMRMFSLPDTSDVRNGLSQLQNADGSWSWWNGMRGSAHVTASVARLLARLTHYGLSDAETDAMLRKAMPYLLNVLSMEAAELRKMQQKNPKLSTMPSSTAIDILYICSMTDGKYDVADRAAQRDIKYLISLTEKHSSGLSLYSKAQMAVIHAVKGSRRKSLEHIKSLKEYSVFTPEAGRYYDAPRAEYSWRNYRIPTEVAVIEAMRIVTPEDTQTIEEMQRWLLHEKRTQQWDNSLNTADAIYAFMQITEEKSQWKDHREKTTVEDTARIMFDGRLLEMKNGVADIPLTDDMRSATLSAYKPSSTTSWGALMLEQRVPLTSVSTQGEGFSVKREIICHDAQPAVGSKVTVRITVTALRDYDFVEVRDNRSACLQPVCQLSGYHVAQSSATARCSYAGYYRVTGDNATIYYFDRLAKGKHVIETDYHIDRKGTYCMGLASVKSTYAPEFSGTASAEGRLVCTMPSRDENQAAPAD